MKRKLVWILCLTLCIAGGLIFFMNNNQRKKLDQAEYVLTILLNAPDSDIYEMYEELYNQMSADKEVQAESTDNAKQILTKRLNDYTTDAFITSCLMGNEIIDLQFNAYLKGFSTKATSISISKTQQRHQVSFDATLQLSGNGLDGEEVQVSGLVQFNDSGKIETITLRGTELHK